MFILKILVLVAGMQFLVYGCSPGQSRSPFANPNTPAPLASAAAQSALTRSFTQLTNAAIAARIDDFVAVAQPAPGAFVLLSAKGKAVIYEDTKRTATVSESSLEPKDATIILALPDDELWFVTKSEVGHSLADPSGAEGPSNQHLALDFPQDGPRLLGVGPSWLVLFYSGRAHVIRDIASKLTITTTVLPESLFGGESPLAAGVSADGGMLWLWSKDGLRVVKAGADSAIPTWVSRDLSLELAGSVQIKGAAFSAVLEKGSIGVPGAMVVLTEKGAFLSRGDAREPEPVPSSPSPEASAAPSASPSGTPAASPSGTPAASPSPT